MERLEQGFQTFFGSMYLYLVILIFGSTPPVPDTYSSRRLSFIHIETKSLFCDSSVQNEKIQWLGQIKKFMNMKHKKNFYIINK